MAPDTGAAAAPSVLLMARAPRPGLCKRRLEPVLGPDGCARLQAVLIARAAAWGRELAPQRLSVACSPSDAAEDVAALVGDGARVFAQEGEGLGERLAAATARAAADGAPLLVLYPDVPQLSHRHAQAALDDLADGVDVSVGPDTGGGFYLLVMAAHRPELFAAGAAASATGSQGGVVGGMLAAVGAAGLRFGLLASERGLHTPDDARALLADPLTPDEVRQALPGDVFGPG